MGRKAREPGKGHPPRVKRKRVCPLCGVEKWLWDHHDGCMRCFLEKVERSREEQKAMTARFEERISEQ